MNISVCLEWPAKLVGHCKVRELKNLLTIYASLSTGATARWV